MIAGRRGWPGFRGDRRLRIVLLAVLAVAAAAVLVGRCLFVVPANHWAYVLNWGRPVRGPILEPGLRLKWPWQTGVLLDGRWRVRAMPAVWGHTADGRPLVVQAYTVWRISATGSVRYLETLASGGRAEELLADLVRSELDRLIGTTRLNDWLGRPEGAGAGESPSLEAMSVRLAGAAGPRAAAGWGLELAEARICRIGVPDPVHESLLLHTRLWRQRQREREVDRSRLLAGQILAAARVEAEETLRRARQQAMVIRREGCRQSESLLEQARRLDPLLTRIAETLAAGESPAPLPPAAADTPAAGTPAGTAATTPARPRESAETSPHGVAGTAPAPIAAPHAPVSAEQTTRPAGPDAPP